MNRYTPECSDSWYCLAWINLNTFPQYSHGYVPLIVANAKILEYLTRHLRFSLGYCFLFRFTSQLLLRTWETIKQSLTTSRESSMPTKNRAIGATRRLRQRIVVDYKMSIQYPPRFNKMISLNCIGLIFFVILRMYIVKHLRIFWSQQVSCS